MPIKTPTSPVKHGDFTGLAQHYSKYRPNYADSVLTCLLALLHKSVDQLDLVDVGAGTGIWTRQLAVQGPHSLIAVEPNDDMRRYGEQDNGGLPIQWRKGSGEETGLPAGCCDMVSMASSFHWTNFETSTKEFHRLLRAGGRFVALWNPRWIQDNPLLVDIENKLYALAPHIKRVSSGRSDFTEQLTERLWTSPYFTDVVYLEGRHVLSLTPEQYMGAWWSVNDIQIQSGPEIFQQFMAYVEEKLSGLSTLEATYWTRAWSARKRD